jgi:hypothetical protein
MGLLFRAQKPATQWPLGLSLALLFLGTGLHLAECAHIQSRGGRYDMTMALPLMVAGMFMSLRHLSNWRLPWAHWGRDVFAAYLLHVALLLGLATVTDLSAWPFIWVIVITLVSLLCARALKKWDLINRWAF